MVVSPLKVSSQPALTQHYEHRQEPKPKTLLSIPSVSRADAGFIGPSDTDYGNCCKRLAFKRRLVFKRLPYSCDTAHIFYPKYPKYRSLTKPASIETITNYSNALPCRHISRKQSFEFIDLPLESDERAPGRGQRQEKRSNEAEAP